MPKAGQGEGPARLTSLQEVRLVVLVLPLYARDVVVQADGVAQTLVALFETEATFGSQLTQIARGMAMTKIIRVPVPAYRSSI